MNSLFYIVLLAIFAVPFCGFIPLRGTDLWYVQYLGLLSVFHIATAVFLWRFNWLWSAFILFCLYSTIVITNQSPKAILVLNQISFSALAVYFISKFSENQHKTILKVIFLLVLTQFLYVVIQKFNLDPFFDNISNRTLDDTVGVLGSHNQIGLFFAITAPVVAFMFPPLLIFTVIGLAWSTTSTAFLGFVSGLAVLVFYTAKWTTAVLLIIIFIFISVYYVKFFDNVNKVNVSERLSLWKQSIESTNNGRLNMHLDGITRVLACNPWFGFGLSKFMSASPYSQIEFLKKSPTYVSNSNYHTYEHAHNDYVEAYFEFGRIGFLIVMALIIDIFVNFLRTQKTKILVVSFSAIFAHMVCAMGIYTTQNAVTGMILVIFLGIFRGEVNRQKEGVYASKAGT